MRHTIILAGVLACLVVGSVAGVAGADATIAAATTAGPSTDGITFSQDMLLFSPSSIVPAVGADTARAAAVDQQTHTIKITTPKPRVSYTIAASGLTALEKTDLDDTDEIHGNTASGTVGLNGIDKYRFTGSLIVFQSNDTDALTVWIDEEKVDPEVLEQRGYSSTPDSEEDDDQPSTATPTTTEPPTPTSTPTQTATPQEPNIHVTSLNANKTVARVGEPIKITTVLTNTGRGAGTHTVEVSSANQSITKTIALRPNESREISFIVEYSRPGNFTLTVGELQLTVQIRPQQTTPTTTDDAPLNFSQFANDTNLRSPTTSTSTPTTTPEVSTEPSPVSPQPSTADRRGVENRSPVDNQITATESGAKPNNTTSAANTSKVANGDTEATSSEFDILYISLGIACLFLLGAIGIEKFDLRDRL